MREHAKKYCSHSPEYVRAFEVFRKRTDQKTRARERLLGLVDTLSKRDVFIDIGAADGMFTAELADHFSRTIAVEPNRTFCETLHKRLPAVKLIPQTLMNAEPGALCDLALCAHVLFHIKRAEWPASVARMLSWLSDDGVLVVLLQNPQSDCMRMLSYFGIDFFTLRDLMPLIEREIPRASGVRLERVESLIETTSLDEAYTISEFMLNCLSDCDPPTRSALEEYVQMSFRNGKGGYRFTCDQDLLVVASHHV